jgi:hypothetical protein
VTEDEHAEDDLVTITGVLEWKHNCPSVGGGEVTSYQIRVPRGGGQAQLYCAGCNDGYGWTPWPQAAAGKAPQQ